MVELGWERIKDGLITLESQLSISGWFKLYDWLRGCSFLKMGEFRINEAWWEGEVTHHLDVTGELRGWISGSLRRNQGEIIIRSSRNRTHINDFEDHRSTIELYPLVTPNTGTKITLIVSCFYKGWGNKIVIHLKNKTLSVAYWYGCQLFAHRY